LNYKIKTYNEKRSHQSLKKMPPVKYENQLKEIAKETRKKMIIYTVKINEDDPLNKQLTLFEPL
jgi:hypothetical protein